MTLTSDHRFRRRLVDVYLEKGNKVTWDNLALKDASRDELIALCAYLVETYVEPHYQFVVKLATE